MCSRFIILLSALIFSGKSLAQNFDSLCLQQKLVMSSFTVNHINPPAFDNKTFSEIIDLFSEEADGRRVFFYKQDVEKMKQIVETGSAETISCDVLKYSYEVFKERIKQIDSILNKIESTSITFSEKDTVIFLSDNSKPKLCSSVNDLQARIMKRIKYDCLILFIKPLKENEDVTALAPPEMVNRQTACKKKAILRYRRYLDDFKNDIFLGRKIADALSNSIAHRCDPHSSYFNSYEKEQFESALSTEELSFGFYASENDAGEIIIGELIPGGPAWKSSRLHVGDVILGFKFKDEESVELEFSDLDDFYDAFYKSEAKQVELKLRKKDNQIITVPLKKEKIQSQDNLMTSYILKQNNLRIGYISIPSFYTDDEGSSRSGCSNDVAKEIIKLKGDTIDGLIIDLRYNGGGSMAEAMGLSGIFIDEGPLAIYKSRKGKPFVLKDFNRGSIYDDPLLVLVNGGSASASEFFTASMRDYNRAVIAGSTTYGKGTAQNVLPADTNLYKAKGRRYYINPALGFTKVTSGKFYSVNAATHQGKGIVPDIHIPDLIEKLYEKESDQLYNLSADSVNKKVVYQQLPALPVSQLREKSEQRILAEKKFAEIQRIGDSLNLSRGKEYKLTLTPIAFKKYFDKTEQLNERLVELMKSNVNDFNVRSNSYTQRLTEFDEYQKKINEETIEDLEKDIILYEAFSIMKDLISIQK